MKLVKFFLLVFVLFFICFPHFVEADQKDDLFIKFLWDTVYRDNIKDRPRVAVVLSGGGARGLAHAGVLKVLREENIPVDIVVGASVGALIGSLYASGIEPETIEEMALGINWKKLITFHLTYKSIYSTKKMEAYVNKYIKNKRFDELEIPFACVAVDVQTGEKIIFREGLVAPAVRASASIPGVFEPVEYRHRLLIDGGVIDNVPIDIAQIMGADIIIAVAVNVDIANMKTNNMLKIMTQVINIQSNYISSSQLKNADVIITPELTDVATSDLDKAKECIDAGKVATRTVIPEIKKIILRKVFNQVINTN